MRLGGAGALLALPVAAIAVTLSDFKSSQDTLKQSDLPDGCGEVYTATISGCTANDFPKGGNACSSACAQGVSDMVAKVQDACGNKGLKGIGIITAFLEGNGPTAICGSSAKVPNPYDDETSSQGPATSTGTQSSSSPSSTESNSASITSTSENATATATSTISITSTATEQTAILVDTASPVAPTATSSSQSRPTSNNDNYSGQGSPFDTLSSGTTRSACFSVVTVILAAAMACNGILRR
ncbi:hypothetical protein CERZMDRAFT_93541 [Cercospora zeae-maydis SCOH1-5]|uniref:Extracellular membrane protein CFEM domain-containing protein n=1 Tax=Cercospora zeae-maydis SCOH1-5 TaxID=717836 RepID=A0A6A6FSI6_9PEZI|nr:hypothetical protein CERZMDRAFT_93541 [Cercospora zeae-maydis SCOH1-5]